MRLSQRPQALVGATVLAVGLALATAWAFAIPLDRALVLAPVLVVACGLVAGVAVLLVRAAIESTRASGHPRLVVGTIAGLVALGVILTVLGIELPRE
jgi:hypothetical protein